MAEMEEYDTSGIKMNKKGLKSTLDLSSQNPDCEYMYLRENYLREFKTPKTMLNLKVLDMSLNAIQGSCEWLMHLPNIKHLYLTGNQINSLHGFSGLDELETLAISSNAITSFDGLDSLPKLRVLSLSSNHIESFENFPLLPSLYSLSLAGNPIAEIPKYRHLTIAVCNKFSLCKLDGEDIEEQEEVEAYRGKVAFCMTEGFVPDSDGTIEEQCAKFLLARQQEQSAGKSLWPHHVAVESAGGRHQEGESVVLTVCLQDMREIAVRKRNIFYSRHLFPVAFKVSGEAKEVFVLGSMNKWMGAIPLQRCKDEDGSVYFQTTLYLPAGEYEYRYLVDGMEKISEHNKTTCKYTEGMCNVYKVVPSALIEGEEEVQETILHIRWHRSNEYNVFSLIPDENGLEYIPTALDVGQCLRVEVLAYLDGNFHCMVCDISTPVEPGPPKVTDLRIDGAPCEGQTLKIEGLYTGGVEGSSEIRWSRLHPDGKEEPVEVDNAWEGYLLTAADIGCQIRAVYIPIRADWVTGRPEEAISEAITAGIPVCRSLNVLGQFVEQEPLAVEAEYGGGTEGESRYQWMREAPESTPDCPVFELIPGETGTSYVPTQRDVARCLAVDYTPVSAEGVEGETNRFITDEIEAGFPMLSSLEILGDPMEGCELEVLALYYGGYPGQHLVQWFRQEERNGQKVRVKVGTPRALKYVPTQRDVGCVLEVACTPVRDDGVRGEQHLVCTSTPVQPHLPEITSLSLEGTFALGETVRVKVAYVGGAEGASVVQWARTTVDQAVMEPILANPGQTDPLQHTISPEDCGHCLLVRYTPRRNDGVVGESVSVISPVVMAAPPQPGAVVERGPIEVGRPVTGSWHNFPRPPVSHRWLRLSPDGTEKVIRTVSHGGPLAYTPTAEDVGARLLYGVKLDKPGERSQWVYSEPSAAPVAPAGTHPRTSTPPPLQSVPRNHSPTDAGAQTRSSSLVPPAAQPSPTSPGLATPATPASATNPNSSEPTEVMDDASSEKSGDSGEEGRGMVLLPPMAIEGVPLTPRVVGATLNFARLVIGWSRCYPSGETIVVSRELTYTPSAHDVGCDLLCTVLPLGTLDLVLEGAVGPVEPCDSEAALIELANSLEVPVGKDCRLAGTPAVGAQLTAHVTYVCGEPEGKSMCRWFLMDSAGREALLPGAHDRTLPLSPRELGCRIKFEYTPVTSSNIPGVPVTAVSDVVTPAPSGSPGRQKPPRSPARNDPGSPPRKGPASPAGRRSPGSPPLRTPPGSPSPRPGPFSLNLSLPARSYCMRRADLTGVPSGDALALAFKWEAAPSGAATWQPVGPWTCVCRAPTLTLTADHADHLVRAVVHDSTRTLGVSNGTAVTLDPAIHLRVLEEIAMGQTSLYMQDLEGAPCEITLAHDVMKLKSGGRKVEVRWSLFEGIHLSMDRDCEFVLQYHARAAACGTTLCTLKRVDRDMVALLVRAYHGLATKDAADFVGTDFARKWANGALRKLKNKAQGLQLLTTALQAPPPPPTPRKAAPPPPTPGRHALALLRKQVLGLH